MDRSKVKSRLACAFDVLAPALLACGLVYGLFELLRLLKIL